MKRHGPASPAAGLSTSAPLATHTHPAGATIVVSNGVRSASFEAGEQGRGGRDQSTVCVPPWVQVRVHVPVALVIDVLDESVAARVERHIRLDGEDVDSVRAQVIPPGRGRP